MIGQHTATVIVRPIGLELDERDVRFTIDEGWSPFGQATITCRLPDSEGRELLDLRGDDLDIDLRLRRDFGQVWSVAELPSSVAGLTELLAAGPLSTITNTLFQPWNGAAVLASQRLDAALVITERSFDDVDRTLTIEAATREHRLQGDILMATAALDPGTADARAIVAWVLASRYGYDLAPGTAGGVVAEATATLWPPGTSAWDYLDNILEPLSLRLWADLDGLFHLTVRQATVEGAIVLSPSTMTGHRDTMSLDPEQWCDAVLVIYRWVDAFDLNQVAYDFAGEQPSRAGLVVERNAVYPGPGAASGILNRMQGRGRVLDVTADSDYRARPGMAATINPPESIALTGYGSAITWRLPAAEMDVQTRGLVDTPPTSWLFVEPGTSWNDVPVGMSWLEYTPEGV